jgi:hypothetical protein
VGVGVGMSFGALAACGPSRNDDLGDDQLMVDSDGDGVKTPADCDDRNPMVHPGATETCNDRDDDCSGRIDEPFDKDGDQHGTCGRDCDDNDPTRYVGAPEILNGKDDDCDGVPDNHRNDTDDDGDGYTEDEGDCNDSERQVNPGAVEVQTKMDGTPEGVDNDCNGLVDEGPQACGQGQNPQSPTDLARALDLCKNLTAASMNADSDAMAKAIVWSFGSYTPKNGPNMVSLSTGTATAPVNGFYAFPGQSGKPHPSPKGDPGDGCGKADEGTVYDSTELVLEIDVPVNALSMSFDFNFMSTEYPEWVCKRYDDTFLALLTSQQFNGNVSFDAKGKPVTVNSGFFDVCAVGSEPPGKPAQSCTGNAALAGTGYQNGIGGGTGWLTTTVPVKPLEHITLKLTIFDEGDQSFDSSVLIDNFRWFGTPVDGPITVPRR